MISIDDARQQRSVRSDLVEDHCIVCTRGGVRDNYFDGVNVLGFLRLVRHMTPEEVEILESSRNEFRRCGGIGEYPYQSWIVSAWAEVLR